MKRTRFLLGSLTAAIGGCFGSRHLLEIASARTKAALVFPFDTWSSDHLQNLISALNEEELTLLAKSLEITEAPATAVLITKQIVWYSSSILTYPFKDKMKFDYHAIVKWVALKQGANTEGSTYKVERALLGQVFAKMWDHLNQNQRKELLIKINSNGHIKDVAGTAALSGSAALAVLSATTYFSGFAFYTTMSSVIYTVAGFLNITVPFSGYMSASSTVAALSGPIGWTLIAIGAIIGVVLLGGANAGKLIPFLIQLHFIKTTSLQKAGLFEATSAKLNIS